MTDVDESIVFEHRSPWILVAEGSDKSLGEDGLFESHGLGADVGEAYPVGSEVTVYYLPEKPNICAFDLNRLPGRNTATERFRPETNGYFSDISTRDCHPDSNAVLIC